MRDYLYVWHRPKLNCLITSGIEFRDFVPSVSDAGGLVLLRHGYGDALPDQSTKFEFVRDDGIADLANDNIYNYGDFRWADFSSETNLSGLSDEAIAELTFFGHSARPLRGVAISGLSNRFLVAAHDDGWHARIFYSEWKFAGALLQRLLRTLLSEHEATATLESVARAESAFWISRNSVARCEETEDIDRLLKGRVP